jgi:hypothetical protein
MVSLNNSEELGLLRGATAKGHVYQVSMAHQIQCLVRISICRVAETANRNFSISFEKSIGVHQMVFTTSQLIPKADSSLPQITALITYFRVSNVRLICRLSGRRMRLGISCLGKCHIHVLAG